MEIWPNEVCDILSEKKGCMKKSNDQFLAKTNKYLYNLDIINLSSAIFPYWSRRHTRL